MSKRGKSNISDVIESSTWLDVHLPTIMSLLERNDMDLSFVRILLDETRDFGQSEDRVMLTKIRNLCLERKVKWRSSFTGDGWGTQFPTTKVKLRY